MLHWGYVMLDQKIDHVIKMTPKWHQNDIKMTSKWVKNFIFLCWVEVLLCWTRKLTMSWKWPKNDLKMTSKQFHISMLDWGSVMLDHVIKMTQKWQNILPNSLCHQQPPNRQLCELTQLQLPSKVDVDIIFHNFIDSALLLFPFAASPPSNFFFLCCAAGIVFDQRSKLWFIYQSAPWPT